MFELNGQPYTLEDLQESAKSQDIEFENFMNIMKVKGLTEKSNDDFLQPYTFSIKNKDESINVFTGDDAIKIKNKLVYKNQSTDLDVIAEYNENEFSQWVTEILPNSNVVVKDTGLFWDDKSIVKIPGMDAMTIDLQPMTSGEGVSGVLFGGGKKQVKEQIAKIIKFAEDRYENENKYVGVYTDWAPNAYDPDLSDSSSVGIRNVKGFDRLQKMYQKIGLKITKETGGYTGSTYVVFDEIEGKEVFRGTAELNGGISDFMYNYSKSSFSEDQHNTLKLERQAQVAFEMKPTVDAHTGTHTNIEKILYDDSSLENIVRTSAYNSDVERNKIKILLENQRKNLNVKQSNDLRLLEKQQKNIIKEAVENGVTSIDFDENLRIYTLKGSNKEQVSKYTNLINDWLHTVDLNRSLYLAASNDLDVEDANIITQEKSLGVGGGEFSKVAAKSRSVFGRLRQANRDSWDKLVLSPFVMFGNDEAIKQQNLIQQRYDKKYGGVFDLTAGEAIAQGRFLEYGAQVYADNGAITTLSLATAGIAGGLGAGVKATQWTIAGVAAFNGGGEKRFELENLEDSVEDVKQTLNDLEKHKNLIPKQKYQEISLELNKFIADNDYSGWQQFGSVSTAFVAEGFFTKYIGASNFTNAVGGFANPTKDLAKRIFMENTEATLRGVLEISKGVAKEILEEELIYVSNVLADVNILNRDFDSKEFIAGGKKVAIDAAIISGPMVGTGTTYSTVMTQMATAPIKAEYNKIKKELQGIDADLKALDPSDVDYQSTYDGLMSKRSDLLYNKLGMLGGEMELGAMSLEGKDLNNLIISGRILDDLIAQAGIDPTLSDKLKNKKIQEYAKSLDPEKALEFKKKYNSALEIKKEALSKVDFTNSVKNLGIRGEKILEKLIKKNPKLKNATTKEQAIAVYTEFKNYLADVRIGVGRNNPDAVDLVESIVYGEGGFSNSKTKKGEKRKRRNLKAENDLYYQLGAVLQDRITKNVVISNKDNSKAASILQDVRLQDVTTVAAPADDVLQEEIMQAYDELAQQEIEKINKSSRSKESKKSEIQKILAKYEGQSNQVVSLVRSGKANAAIVGDKYIVRDKKAADAAINEGNILAGTALSHEVGHAIDALAFDTAGITNYGKNLFDYMEKNFPKAHKSAIQIQVALGNYNIKGEFPKGEDIFYDEYSKEIQSYFIRNKQEQANLLKLTPSIPNVLRGVFGLPSVDGGEINVDKGYEIKTPKDAAVYLASFLKGYEGGEMGTLQKRRIDRRKKLGLERGETKTKFSKEASEKVQQIFEEKGVDGAFEIIEKFKPIVSKIVEKRRDAPNFDRELLMSEIEIGQRGILDLIRDYKPDSGVPLAAYINKFLPARAIEASRRVLGEEFTQDVTEAKGVAAEEVVTEVKTKPRKKKIVIADRLGVSEKIAKAIERIVSGLDLSSVNFKNLKNQIPEITGELFGIAPKKITSLANLTKKELQAAQMFINKNADLLIAMLPEGATTGGTATGIPNTLLKAFYTKTDRAKAAKTGSTSGLAIQEKNNITKKQFLETFGIIDGKPTRSDRNISARVLAIANLTGKMITNQAVRQKLAKNDKTTGDIIRGIQDGKSDVMFSLNPEMTLEESSQAFKKSYQLSLEELGGIINYKLAPLIKKKRKNSEGETVEYSTRDLNADLVIDGEPTGETILQGATRVVTDFLKQHPQFRSILRSTLTGGENKAGGVFQTVKVFDELIPATDTKQVGKRKEYKTNKFVSGGFDQTYLEDYDALDENKKLEVLLSFFKATESYLDPKKGKPADAWMFIELIRDTAKHQNTFTRILAKFGFYPVYKNGDVINDKKVVEEHTDPQNLIGKSLLAGAMQGKVDFVWKVIGKSYMQGPLLNSKKHPHDDIVNKAGMEQSMPNVYYELIVPRLISGELDIPNGFASIVRLAYAVHPETGQRIDLNMYFLPEVNMTITEYFGVDGITDIAQQNKLIIDFLAGKITRGQIDAMQKVKLTKKVESVKKLDKSINVSRTSKYSMSTKGITVLDFDDTLATSKSLIRYTKPDGDKGTLTPEQYASTYQDLLGLGYEFDFSEFNKVVDGKTAPLFQKALKLQGKFGPKSMFVLTARPAESAPAIFAFLKANGLNIPLKNITGLANSTAEAKALWIADKVAEGFNDFYFADDALQNVQAVDNMLEQFDVKRKVQQAKVKFSESMNVDFNNILEELTGIESKKRFDFIKARKRGAGKGKFRLFIPPSHEDFVGLLYNFMGKGRRGDAHREFLEQALIRPLNRANIEYDTARQSVATDYKNLNKAMPDVKKKLTKKTPDGDFTYQDAIRVYLWDKHGYDIPGLSDIDQKKLVEIVTSDGDLQYYAETINLISKQETYVDPTDGWDSGDIRMDLDDATGRIGRAQFFEEFIENADIIFSKENLNKIEAGFGKGVRDALEDMLYRIKTGRNKPTGQSKMVNDLMNWVNGSVGSVMFFNMRSALLQQMSLVNYINFADNNIFAAAKAFANQKQYWDDWSMIFNSDMLKQRRGGIQTDVNGAELAAEMRKSKNPHRFLISKLLELGFLPTQIGDNIAIATGGATYYRNRVNTYLKDGLSKSEAEKKAFVDFQDITQSTQQSARPDMVSKQQASLIGKIILNFQNVTSQFNRLGKKAFLDIKNRRITGPNKTQMQSDISNAARITYYFAVQNLIFYTLQTALFAMMFGDDEEDNNNLFLKKQERLINGSIDSVLRGSGMFGAVLSTLKNVAIAFARQRDINYNPDESAVLIEALNFSPVIGIKARKVSNAEKTLNYNKKVIAEMETFDIDNPQWSAITNYIEAGTNLPVNRLYNKTQNVRQGFNNDHAAWERTLMFLGWSQYNLNLGNKKIEEIKAKIKADNKIKNKKNKKKKSNLQTL